MPGTQIKIGVENLIFNPYFYPQKDLDYLFNSFSK